MSRLLHGILFALLFALCFGGPIYVLIYLWWRSCFAGEENRKVNEWLRTGKL